jgi:hypothetical protein
MVLVYVVSYIADSAFGGYWLQPERDGNHRLHGGLSLHTAILWQPAYGYCASYNSDFLGAVFSPLVALDRAWVHPTMYVTDDSTFEWIRHQARPSHIHPHFRSEFIHTRQQAGGSI